MKKCAIMRKLYSHYSTFFSEIFMTLEQFFKEHPVVGIAFSGGVDSTYLLYEALKHAEYVKAYYVKSAFQPSFELGDAFRLSSELSFDMGIEPLNILRKEAVIKNDADRCYHCKKAIMTAVYEAAGRDGISVILDGTNASDPEDERPGMRAIKELGILSPLRLCGLTKADIRRLSKEAGLFTWDKPAYACLATRIPTGTEITKEMLIRTEKAEEYLSSLGFSDFRVRYAAGDTAKIQLKKEQLELFLSCRQKILKKLKKYYTDVCLDLELRP